MSTAPRNELLEFHDFLATKISSGDEEMTPEEAVTEFREYQAELERFLAESRASMLDAERGITFPLDVEDLKK
jgi:hypothetical protein